MYYAFLQHLQVAYDNALGIVVENIEHYICSVYIMCYQCIYTYL